MNILVLRIGRLGDFIVSIPAIASLRRQFPQARITLLTAASTDRAMRQETLRYSTEANLPWVGLVKPGIVDDAFLFSSPGDLRRFRELRGDLRRQKFDRCYLLPYTDDSFKSRAKNWLFVRALGINCPLYGFGKNPGKGIHQVDAALSAVEPDRKFGTQVQFPLSIGEVAESWADARWQERGFKGRLAMAVFTGGTHQFKMWPLERFRAVCNELRSATGCAIVAIGSGKERKLGEALVDGLTDSWNACGETDIQQLAALLRRCGLYLGNDSGPGHLAAALGVPCISIMSGIHPPGVWEPWGKDNRAFRHIMPCDGCRSESHCPRGTPDCVLMTDAAPVGRACLQAIRGSK